MARRKSAREDHKKKRRAKGEAEEKPRFYCETCGREVPPEVDECPYCGMPFYAVMCPKCGYTGKATEFVDGCPKCGYLGASSMGGSQDRRGTANDGGAAERAGQTARPGRKTAMPEGAAGAREIYPAEEILGERRRTASKKKGQMPGWLFFILILLLGTVFAGLLVMYLNL